ncbi:Non-specific serine/threonine protein kinase protein [Dioscorea alata]|uniref:Non-specific serine/threonine protein kinase protein n=1 Tax=Dioscorea alata TaxID=55571 RepID=A0ACB7VLU8_DIOAL|nr:Non-specific serine/threonine protein kinase protein [Dioscorea alata]
MGSGGLFDEIWRTSIFGGERGYLVIVATIAVKMISGSCSSRLIVLVIIFILIPNSSQLQSSQAWTLLRIRRLLNYPSVLSNWNSYTNICDLEQNPSVTVVCYEESITQLHIIGNESSSPLPASFSIKSLFTTIARLPNLKVLSLRSLGLWGHLPGKISHLSALEIVNMSSNFLYGVIPQQISSLENLQTLVLDHNMFSGQVPDWLSSLPLLTFLSLENNNLTGRLPDSLSKLKTLRMLVLSSNRLSGNVPDLRPLTNLQELHLEDNRLGPQFPRLGNRLVSLTLQKNRFTGSLPSEVASYFLLQRLDISSNRFVGPFLPSLLILPCIQHLNISGNRFTGMLYENMSCSEGLESADLSANLLTGNIPGCLISNHDNKVVLYSDNCLVTKIQSQHPYAYCQNQALAVGILPHEQKKTSASNPIYLTGLIGGIILSVIVVCLVIFFTIRRVNAKRATERSPRRLIEHASYGYSSKLLADARYISVTKKLGALGVPAYRSFSLEELEAATNNFATSAFMGEGSHGHELYKGSLKDGSLAVIRCLKLHRGHNSQNYNRHIEIISKLRHRHLVCALGHCFDYYTDDSSISRVFLIFEYVPNGTLRSSISEGVAGQKLNWPQRIAAAIGVARGIQFLHAGIIPGLFANNLKTTNILLDQNLVTKISSYNLPVFFENVKNEVAPGSSLDGSNDERTKHLDKVDIYDFGIILLEIISGRVITSQHEIETVKDELQASITTEDDGAPRRSIVDPVFPRATCDESLKTVIDICIRCLSMDPMERPSIEDVLWNLQFASQVHDGWKQSSTSSDEPPLNEPHL